MKSYQQKDNKELKNVMNEDAVEYSTKVEEDRLREAIRMSDMEKFRLFTQMLRANALYKRAIVTHKK
jgi:hypothetical protein